MEKLKALRLLRGMTQQQLADAVGITDAAVCQHESGAREPNLDLIRKYCKVLHCTPNELLADPKEADDVKSEDAAVAE